MRWKGFERSAPKLALQVRRTFDRNGLALVGTIRRDGSPRISPTEVFFLPDELLVGMMRGSKKALDLLRDPRCVVHSTISDPNGSEPEAKLYCRAVAGDAKVRSSYSRAYARRWKRSPPESFPAYTFAMDLKSVAFIRYDTRKSIMVLQHWTPEGGLKETRQEYP